MPRCLVIQPHLSLDEIEKRYRQATNASQRSHYRVIWFLAQATVSDSWTHQLSLVTSSGSLSVCN